jgi:hypothetical protein
MEYDSKRLIGRVHERYEELSRKQYEWTAFYTGWLEGRADMLREMREMEFPGITSIVTAHIDDTRGMTPDEWRQLGRCASGHDIRGVTVRGYPHPDGYETPVGKYWLYIRCPICGNDTSLWKVGINKGTKFEVV